MQLIDYTNAVRHAPAFDGHQRISLIQDQASGLTALIAIHNVNLGPAVGGCRMFNSSVYLRFKPPSFRRVALS